MGNLGIDPSTSRMQSGRSIIWATTAPARKPAWIIKGIEIFREKLGSRKSLADLEILEAFVIALELSFSGDFSSRRFYLELTILYPCN